MSVEEYYKQIEARGKRTPKEYMDDIQEVSERMSRLLKDRESGLASYFRMFGEIGREMAAHLKYAGLDK